MDAKRMEENGVGNDGLMSTKVDVTAVGDDLGNQKLLGKRRISADNANSEAFDFSREDLAGMSRSERKRHREKKRRSDVNKGFDDLMNLLVEIDPALKTETVEKTNRVHGKTNEGTIEDKDNVLSRVELISRTVEVLGRIHRENEERKAIIAQLMKHNEQSQIDPASQLRLTSDLTGPSTSTGTPLSTMDSFAFHHRNALRNAEEQRGQMLNQVILNGLSLSDQQFSSGSMGGHPYRPSPQESHPTITGILSPNFRALQNNSSQAQGAASLQQLLGVPGSSIYSSHHQSLRAALLQQLLQGSDHIRGDTQPNQDSNFRQF